MFQVLLPSTTCLSHLGVGGLTQPYRLGREFQELCSTLRHADERISESILRLDNSWLRFTHQLNFLQRVENLMDSGHHEIHQRTLRTFLDKLEVVTAMLRGLVKNKPHETGTLLDCGFRARKGRYLVEKAALDKAVEELEVWQRIADQSWFLIMKIADPKIDRALVETGSIGSGSSTAAAIPSTVSIRSGIKAMEVLTATGSGLRLDAKALEAMTIELIPYSLAALAHRVFTTGGTHTYLLNYIQVSPMRKYDVIHKDTRDLARRLQHKDPSHFGLLTCKGFVAPSKQALTASVASGVPEPKSQDEMAFVLVFRMPPDVASGSPRSLRDFLLHTSGPASLSARFDMARELAKAVGYVHTFGFVHKNVRPESVLVFDSTTPPPRITPTASTASPSRSSSSATSAHSPSPSLTSQLSQFSQMSLHSEYAPSSQHPQTLATRWSPQPQRQPQQPSQTSQMPQQSQSLLYLAGFENFRREEGLSLRSGDEDVARNLYRHPTRQGACPSEDYVMQHDIYSLGVCLLEIGLWRSLVVFSSDDDLKSGGSGERVNRREDTRAMAADLLGVPPSGFVSSQDVTAFLQTEAKDQLLDLARTELSRYMGTKYAEVVETCLTCLDPENADFGDPREFQDHDGIRVGVRYIEKVILRLNKLIV